MNALAQLVRAPRAALEFANVVLTAPDAVTAATPRDVVWTYRTTTLYRYRSDRRVHAVPVLLVFALINRPDVFDLRPGNSFVEHLLEEGFDVYLLDWGVPDDEDADRGLDGYVCDELAWGIRETLRCSGQDEVTLLGWCIGATLCAMHCALGSPEVRNLVLLTAPIDTRGSLYARWIGHEGFDPELVTDGWPSVPGPAIDAANKLMKPVANHWTTYRRLWQDVLAGRPVRETWQPMARWVADTPPFPGRAYREWLTWMYRENRLVRGRLRLRGRRVDLRRIDQNLLVVTAAGDHIAPRAGTLPILDLVASEDVTHFDRPGGHIGLMAGSKARHEIWPELAAWLRERSGR
jgi:polyhydroxyalkanoate synthase